MQTCLVTGGAGFIGSHLCKKLLDEGNKVICVDNLITGSEKNIKNLSKNSNFNFIQDDINKISVDDSKLTKVSQIFHLASPASPIDYQQKPEETLLVNSRGTLNMLELAEKTSSKFLLASTSEVYGDPKEHPQKEDYNGNVNTFGPRSCYDESKRFAETAVYVFLQKYKLDARVIRIFNTYGPNMQKDDGRVISNFINWAIEGEDLKIDGDGSQTRSFCYVSDMVEGIYSGMLKEKTKGEIFNLGNPDEYTIKQLAEKIVKMTKSNSNIVYSKNFRTDDPMQRCPNISKAKKILDWEPKVALDEGLEKTIRYYKKVGKNEI